MNRTLIAVMTCALYPQRRAAVRETWMSTPIPGVDIRFFAGNVPIDEADVTRLWCPDDYYSLPLKTHALVVEALKAGYSQMIKVDDDTYLRLPDAVAVLTDGHCVGNVRREPPHNLRISYPQGGCYSLSPRAMQAVITHSDYFTTGQLEDAMIGKALAAEQIPLKHSDRIKTHYQHGQPAPGNDIIAAHHVSPAVMRDIHRFTAKGDI